MRSPANPLALTYRYCGRMTGKREVTTSGRIDTTRKISFGTEQLESLGFKAAETQGLAR